MKSASLTKVRKKTGRVHAATLATPTSTQLKVNRQRKNLLQFRESRWYRARTRAWLSPAEPQQWTQSSTFSRISTHLSTSF